MVTLQAAASSVRFRELKFDKIKPVISLVRRSNYIHKNNYIFGLHLDTKVRNSSKQAR